MYLYSTLFLYTFNCIGGIKNQEITCISIVFKVKCSLNTRSIICSSINGHYRTLVIYVFETVLEQVIHKAEQDIFCGTSINHKTQVSYFITIICAGYNNKG